MKTQSILTISILLAISLHAQITVTNTVFPAASDILNVAMDNNPVGIDAATPPGGNQNWDFSNLKHSSTTKTVFLASPGPNAGSFPDAEVYTNSAGKESYFNITPTKFELLGTAGLDPMGIGVQAVSLFSPALTERRAPLNFFDINQSTSNQTLLFIPADLPAILFQGSPVQPDSVRFHINTQRLDVVDGWGNCQIPGGTYPVLRMKRTEYVSNSVDFYVPPLGWIDISTGGGGGFAGFIGTDTTTAYHFISGTEKEAIAIATLNNAQSAIVSVQFKDNAASAAPEIPASDQGILNAYPNPATVWFDIACANMPNGNYTIYIYNALGHLVWTEMRAFSGDHAVRVGVDGFAAGHYLVQVLDDNGKMVGVKNLVVLK